MDAMAIIRKIEVVGVDVDVKVEKARENISQTHDNANT